MSEPSAAALLGCGLRWSLNPEEVKTESEALMARCDGVLDAIAGVFTSGGASSCTWPAVIAPLAEVDRDVEPATSSITFLKDISVDKAVRAAASAAQAALSAWEVKAGMRKDVYDAVRAYHETHFATDKPAMDAEAVRFVERTMRDYRRRGLALPDDKRAQVEALRTRMSALCVEFQQRLAEEDTKLYFTAAELAGMPADFIESLATKTGEEAAAKGAALSAGPEGTYLEVELNYPHVVPLLKLCSVPSTRAAVEKAFNSRGTPGNTAALEELAELRRQVAGLLGYPTHAEFVLEDKMAGSSGKVREFLSGLGRDLRPLHEADLAALNALKAAGEGPAAGPVNMADYRYYQEKDLKAKYDVDHNALKEYFPLQTVLDGMFHIYQTILGLKFTRVDGEDVGAHVWHPEVSVYHVANAADGRLVGYFYIDLFPRDGKYGHAAVFPLVSGCEAGPVGLKATQNAGRVTPVAACVCNFTKPTPSAPSLLQHSEVETLFHEFGHVMHHLCSETRLHRFASFRCEGDFVEAPSQMLENWCWDTRMLALMSGHYTDPARKLPADMASKLAKSQNAHSGLFNTRQVFLASFDQALHTLPSDSGEPTKVDTGAQLVALHQEVLGIPMTPGTNFGASFGHLAGGYDSAYYGYLWSEVYSADMFQSVFKTDPMDTAAGARYRRHILASGGSKDAFEFLRDFLGREPSTTAFLHSKGLNAA